MLSFLGGHFLFVLLVDENRLRFDQQQRCSGDGVERRRSKSEGKARVSPPTGTKYKTLTFLGGHFVFVLLVDENRHPARSIALAIKTSASAAFEESVNGP
jgi:hypothetical protein